LLNRDKRVEEHPRQPPLTNRNNVVADYKIEINEQEILDESGDVHELNWLEDKDSYVHLTENIIKIE